MGTQLHMHCCSKIKGRCCGKCLSNWFAIPRWSTRSLADK